MNHEQRILEASVRNAFHTIIANRHSKALNFAVVYAEAGLGMEGHELKVQALYVLSNMTHWRNDDAKRIRKLLKDFTKELR